MERPEMKRRIFVLASFVAACSVKVQRLPVAGETLAADSFLLEPGGKGLNVAVGARRLGAGVDGLVTAGDDHFGALAATILEREGLPPEMLVRVPGPTGAGVGLVDAAGENVIAVFPGANALLSADHVALADERLSRAAAVVAQFEIGDEPIAAAFLSARTAGVLTILNPSPYRPIPATVLASTDVMVVNATEAASLARDLAVPPQDDALAAALLAQRVQTLVVTRGASGATVWLNGELAHAAPAVPVAAIDTIGAGDAFLAGLVVGLVEECGWAEALRWGNACGAAVVSATGVIDCMPDRAAMLRLAAGEAEIGLS